MELFTQEQAIILIRLLIAHIIADFILQPSSWVEDKKNRGLLAKGFYKHIFIVGLCTIIAIGNNPFLMLVITLTHALIDYITIRLDRTGALWWFIGDQVLHILVLVLCWLLIIKGWTRMWEVIFSLYSSFPVVLICLGYIFCIWPCSYIIKIATSNLILQSQMGNIKRGGRLIGMFERVIIFTLVLVSQYEAIGFLITGKSILRFADGQKKETEYVLVGTMMSYALALLMGVLVNTLIGK